MIVILWHRNYRISIKHIHLHVRTFIFGIAVNFISRKGNSRLRCVHSKQNVFISTPRKNSLIICCYAVTFWLPHFLVCWHSQNLQNIKKHFQNKTARFKLFEEGLVHDRMNYPALTPKYWRSKKYFDQTETNVFQ